MEPDDYCTRSAAPAGSSGYYASWVANDRERPALVALLAVRIALHDCVEANLDTPAALAKLGFWADELAACLQDHASHPVTQALAPHLAGVASAGTYLEHAVHATGRAIESLPAIDAGATLALAEGLGGELLELFALTARVPAADAARARHVGAAFDLVEGLTRLGREQAAWRVLPQAARQRSEDEGHRRALRAFAEHTARHAREHLDAASDGRALPGPVTALARISSAGLVRLRKLDYDVLGARTSITPIAKFYQAWRAQRTTEHAKDPDKP